MNAFAVCVAIAIALAHVATASLPLGFIGHWHAQPNFTVVGPLTHSGFNFTIASIPAENGNGWLMSDFFDNFLINASEQHFWVLSNEQGTEGTLTYCGVLRNFFNVGGAQTVEAKFVLANQSKHFMQWSLQQNNNFGFNATWTLSLSADEQELTSFLELPPPAIHYLATYQRVAWDPTPHLSAKSKELLALDGVPFHVCNFSSHSGGQVAQKGSACPYGFSRRSRSPSAQELSQAPPAEVQPTLKYRDPFGGAGYQYCYTINPALNVQIRWTWNTSYETLQAMVSANLSSIAPQTNNLYLALGIWPEWPGMSGMDIALGYGDGQTSGCIRSLYAEKFVGRPIESVNQTLTDTKFAITSKGIHHVAFTRPWNSGYNNLNGNYTKQAIPSVSWAIGMVADPSSCASVFHYHNNHRGTYGMWWSQPTAVLPAWMECGASERIA